MNKYEISFVYEESATALVEARSQEEAEHIMEQKLMMDASTNVQCTTMNRDIFVGKALLNKDATTVDIAYGSFDMEEKFDGESE